MKGLIERINSTSLGDSIERNKLTKEVTREIIFQNNFLLNSDLLNELVKLGNITNDKGRITFNLISVNEEGEIIVEPKDESQIDFKDLIKGVSEISLKEKEGREVLDRAIVKKMNERLETIVNTCLEGITDSFNITDGQSVINAIKSIPKEIRSNLSVVGDTVTIATLKLMLAKEGYSNDDILGIKYFINEVANGACLMNLEYLKINYTVNRIEESKDFYSDNLKFLIIQNGIGKIIRENSAIKLNLIVS